MLWPSPMKPFQLRALTSSVALLASAVSAFAQSVPHLTAFVSAADSYPGVALGGLATIYGTGLSDAEHFLSALPYPTKLGPTDVSLCVAHRVAGAGVTPGGCISL